MSDHVVGIIAEGPTDIEIIEGIFRATFPGETFLFRPISPTAEELSLGRKKEGFGWGGVYRVCRGLADRLPLLELMGPAFDCIVIQVDGDVAYKRYRDIGENPSVEDLPCGMEGEPPERACEKLESVVCRWTQPASGRIAVCLPHICLETWVGHWLYPEAWGAVTEAASEDTVYRELLALGRPKAEKDTRRLLVLREGKVRKVTKNYAYAAGVLTSSQWKCTRKTYRQAERFDAALKAALP